MMTSSRQQLLHQEPDFKIKPILKAYDPSDSEKASIKKSDNIHVKLDDSVHHITAVIPQWENTGLNSRDAGFTPFRRPVELSLNPVENPTSRPYWMCGCAAVVLIVVVCVMLYPSNDQGPVAGAVVRSTSRGNTKIGGFEGGIPDQLRKTALRKSHRSTTNVKIDTTTTLSYYSFSSDNNNSHIVMDNATVNKTN